MIDRFDGTRYNFLSNFAPSEVEFEGFKYSTVEHAYQAAKTLNLPARRVFQKDANIGPGYAKRLGQQLDIRPDWDSIKIGVMYFLLTEKFKHISLARKLLATGTEELVEGNDWNDTFWGVCNGVGENYLGKCLMQVRECLQKDMEKNTNGN